jgi:hypothetical protein
MAVEDPVALENEPLSAAEFTAMVRHKGAPMMRVSRPRFWAAVLMGLLGALTLIAGVALIFWPAALVLVGCALLGGAYLIDVSAAVEGDRG